MGSDEEVTVNAILRRLESQAISSMVSASEEMSQDKGHLYWTEGDILWSIEEDMVTETLATVLSHLPLLSTSSAR